MIKKLTRHGNSRALVIDKAILELLNIDDDTELEVETNGRSLLITPVHDETHTDRIRQAYAFVESKHDGLFRRLAK